MEFSVNPDRERMELSLLMALLVNGRTVFEDFSWAVGAERFAIALKEFGLQYEQQGHQLVLSGPGFQYTLPTMLPIDYSEHECVLLWTLASKDSEQLYTFATEMDEAHIATLNVAKECLQKYFKIKIVTDEPGKFVFNFLKEDVVIKKDSLGNIPYIMRNRLLLRALIRNEYLSFEERSSVRDQLTKMFQYFGVALKYEGRGMEQLSEFERRLMMAQGKKIERAQVTELSETKVITAREYYIPGDSTEALALALLVTISTLHKDTVVKIRNVDLNGGRSGAFGCLKRMGANIETTSRREKFGDVYGDLEVRPLQPGKRLQGRRFSEDTIATGLEEYAFLAIAACYAEGETILRVPKEVRSLFRPISDFFAESLRKTGAEVGVYDDGLVIRGLETVVNGSGFDGGKWPQIGLALSVLSIALGNEETVLQSNIVEHTFPLLIEKLRKVLIPETVKGE